MEISTLNGKTQISTLNNSVDRLLIVKEDGTQQWISPNNLITYLLQSGSFIPSKDTINASNIINQTETSYMSIVGGKIDGLMVGNAVNSWGILLVFKTAMYTIRVFFSLNPSVTYSGYAITSPASTTLDWIKFSLA